VTEAAVQGRSNLQIGEEVLFEIIGFCHLESMAEVRLAITCPSVRQE